MASGIALHLSRLLRSIGFGLSVQLATLFAAFGLFCALLVSYQLSDIDETAGLLQLQQQARTLERHIHRDLKSGVSLMLPAQQAAAYASDDTNSFYVLQDAAGQTLSTSSVGLSYRFAGVLGLSPQGGTDTTSIDGRDAAFFFWSEPVPVDGVKVTFTVGRQESAADRLLRDVEKALLRKTASVAIPMALLVLVASLVLIRNAFAPVEMLSRQAEAIGPDNPGMRLTHPNLPSELSALVQAANEAAGRWETDVSRQRRFTADAAHQLLTPLAVLSARLDQDQHAAGSPEMRGDVRRMSRLIVQLLDLSRISNSAQTRERLDLTAVARETVAAMAPLAIAEGKELSFEAPARPCEMFGVPTSIDEALANVILNAIQHAPKGGCIAIRVITPATITVEDDGPGLPKDHIGRLFEPFYTTRGDAGGTGLGLAIVAEVLEQHTGEASAENRLEGGARFTLRFRPASRRSNQTSMVKAAA